MSAAKVTLIYDGMCGYYYRRVRQLASRDGEGRVRVVAFQDLAAPERARLEGRLSLERCRDRLHALDSDGRLYAGFYAFRRVVDELRPWNPLALLLHVPGAGLAGGLIGWALSRLGRRGFIDRDPGLPHRDTACPPSSR